MTRFLHLPAGELRVGDVDADFTGRYKRKVSKVVLPEQRHRLESQHVLITWEYASGPLDTWTSSYHPEAEIHVERAMAMGEGAYEHGSSTAIPFQTGGRREPWSF